MNSPDEYECDIEEDLVRWLPWLETSLDPQHAHIRVLTLHPGLNTDLIICDLKVVSLNENPEYETLSYVWGDPGATSPIQVGGQLYDAPTNLVDLLYCLRRTLSPRFLWADAISIHQSSVVEKNQQLRLMSRIYRQGVGAHIWFGHFTPSWTSEIKSHAYLPETEFTGEHWSQATNFGSQELGIYSKARGKPTESFELSGNDPELLLLALTVLEALSQGKHFHEFPLYLSRGDGDTLNRKWLAIQDCFEWLLSRPWWTRVWTVQEALLPQTDPIIHASALCFPLSTLLNGFGCMQDHMSNCCMWTSKTFVAGQLPFRRSESMGFDRVVSLRNTREEYTEKEPPAIHLPTAIFVSRKRYASFPQDYFFGISALLSQSEQDAWLSSFGYSSGTKEIYNYCSKNMYHASRSLSRLSSAKGTRRSIINGLSTWAVDLCADRERSADGSSGWLLFSASLRSKYICPCTDGTYCRPSPGLMAKSIPVAKVTSCAQMNQIEFKKRVKVPANQIGKLVSEWKQFYFAGVNESRDPSAFWRTLFGDRNIWYYHLHQRQPLSATRTADIQQWWENWERTGDCRDLTFDKKYDDERLGDYHFRALELNVRVRNFFYTANGEPGLGSIYVQPLDEIFVLQGGDELAILRPKNDTEGGYWYVGPCFVDGWMYGEAVNGNTEWQPVVLY